MKKFEFSSKDKEFPVFSGKIFYDVYKDSEFLRHSDNIKTILSKGYELRQSLKEVNPGEIITLKEMHLENNTPLLVKKTGPNVLIENFEFTANRLAGLVAAYAFENRHRFPTLQSSEALALGLTWNNENEQRCKLFLSAVTGTEHFYEQFLYWPLVCAIRKFQLKKIPIELMVKIARVKNPQGVPIAKVMMRNMETVKMIWSLFPGSKTVELQQLLQTAPQQLKLIFFGK